jgi:DNA-nicking Smr family endonuclease
MSRRRLLSEEDRALWAGYIRSIAPLNASRQKSDDQDVNEHPGIQPPPPPPSRPAIAGDARQQNKAPPLAPLGRRLRQRVARGREAIDARLDLHGFTQAGAHAALLRFLQLAQANDARIVLVVTGKGTSRGAEQRERGVLRRQVPLWLALPQFRPLVVGFEDAHVSHGGEGALYVRLRRVR